MTYAKLGYRRLACILACCLAVGAAWSRVEAADNGMNDGVTDELTGVLSEGGSSGLDSSNADTSTSSEKSNSNDDLETAGLVLGGVLLVAVATYFILNWYDSKDAAQHEMDPAITRVELREDLALELTHAIIPSLQSEAYDVEEGGFEQLGKLEISLTHTF